MRFGLLVKLTAPAVALAVVGLGVTTVIGYSKSRAAIESAVHEQQVQAADSVARNARLWIDNRVLEVTGWAGTSIYQKAMDDGFLGKTARKAASKRLQQVKENYPMYHTLFVATPAGEVVATSEEEAGGEGYALSGNPQFETAKGGSFSAVHAVQDPVSGKPVSMFYAPIVNKDATIGVLGAVADLRAFGADFVNPLKSGESGEAEVFRQDGAVFLSSEGDQDFTHNVKDAGLLEKIGDAEGGTLTFDEEGYAHISAFRRVEGLPWTAVVSAREEEVLASARSARTISLLASTLVALFIGGGVLLVVRATLKPVRQAVVSLQDLSQGEGDLTKRLDVQTKDEVGDLGRYFNLFVEKLQSVVKKVKSSTEQVASASQDLATVTEQTNASLNKQRSEVEMIASAVTEMSATAQSVAKNASEAASFAEEADREAENGRSVVDKTIKAIDGLAAEVENSAQVILALRTESQNIEAVLDVIKGIAEQTNLLALNAAIEAARAGEMGRGFAVVADEVRTLAQRTQSSTQEIEQMIESLQGKAGQASDSIDNSHNRAQETVKQAREAGEALQSITQAVQHITDMNHQIASAAEEQSSVTDEITRNVTNIHEVTEETAAASDKTAQSSQELNHSSNELKQVVSQFRV